MSNFDSFITFIGWLVTGGVTTFVVMMSVGFLLREVCRYWANSVAEKMLQVSTMLKLQSVYANRKYLKWVWKMPESDTIPESSNKPIAPENVEFKHEGF